MSLLLYIFFLSVTGHSCASETGSADIFQKDKLDSSGGKKMMGSERLRNEWQTAERSNISLKLIFIANFLEMVGNQLVWLLEPESVYRVEKWETRSDMPDPGEGAGVVWSWISLLMSSFVARWARAPALCSCQLSTAAELWLIALQWAQINCPDRGRLRAFGCCLACGQQLPWHASARADLSVKTRLW